MHSISVIINDEGRPCLKLINNHDCNDKVPGEKLDLDSADKGRRVIIIDLCEDNILSPGTIVIEN
jgi:hypothetical protein